MAANDDWGSALTDHPIFSLSKSINASTDDFETSLVLSTKTLPNFTHVDPPDDENSPSGRRQVMVLKDADLILASGKEIRITSLGDAKLLSQSGKKSYKVLHTPNIQFEIHQIALNLSGKLLAVAGAFQVAVVVLPRPGFTRLVPTTIDCKSIQVGQFYHASHHSAPIAKLQWHPWGEAGSTLMVMTTDGKLREYDISLDADEPQQILSFIHERKSKSYLAEDSSEREVASFTLGKGIADWGPLTVYAVMKSGDIYSICPYMPKNASIPSSYVHSLDCFIAAKQEFLSLDTSATKDISTLYDHQRKFVSALIKQLPPGTVFPAASRSVHMHPPTTMKNQAARQGPFLLQPSPRTLDRSEGGDATDVVYLAFGNDYDGNDDGEMERLGVFLVAYQDGKVDVCLDVEKVEARWENKQDTNLDLPMLAVYESVDLGLISILNRMTPTESDPSILALLQGNHPVFHIDPIHDDVVYLYHAFGVHALHFGSLLQSLSMVLRAETDDDTTLQTSLQKINGTTVQPILSTFSVEQRCSNPVVAVSVPNDVYLTYSILILTSTMRISSFPLTLQSNSPRSRSPDLLLTERKQDSQISFLVEGPPAYVSLLGKEPYVPSPVLSRPLGLPYNPRLSLPSPVSQSEFMLTPDTLRYLGTTVERFTSQIHEVQLAHRAAETRADLQQQEFSRQQSKMHEVLGIMQRLREAQRHVTEERLKSIQDAQKVLLGRLDRILEIFIAKASPELSEHETKWFEELRRMKNEVVGAGQYDEGSLAMRTLLLQREYNRLLPVLKGLLDKENGRKKRFTENNQQLGFSQAFELGQRSNNERIRIASIEDEVLRLAAKLDLPVGRPPSRQKSQVTPPAVSFAS